MNLVALRPRSDHEEKLVRAKLSVRPAMERVPTHIIIIIYCLIRIYGYSVFSSLLSFRLCSVT